MIDPKNAYVGEGGDGLDPELPLVGAEEVPEPAPAPEVPELDPELGGEGEDG